MTVNKPLPSLPTDPSRKALPTPPIKRPIPPPKPSKQEDVKTQEIREQIPQTEVNASKKPTPKASFNIGKSGDKLKKNIGKFFQDFRSEKSSSIKESKVNINELKKSHGIHENLSYEAAVKVLKNRDIDDSMASMDKGEGVHLKNYALMRTDRGKTFITTRFSEGEINNTPIDKLNDEMNKSLKNFVWINPTG